MFKTLVNQINELKAFFFLYLELSALTFAYLKLFSHMYRLFVTIATTNSRK